MPWSNLSNIGYSQPGGYFTYGGYGQFVSRSNPTPEFLRRLQLPNAKANVLATIQVGWRLTAGTNLALGLGQFPLPGDFPVVTVRVNGGGDLPTPHLTSGFFIPTYGYDVTGSSPSRVINLYYIPDLATNTNNYVAILGIYASMTPKSLRSIDWEPRLRTIPNLSLRVEETFGGLFQIGGGIVTLANEDGLFDTLNDAAWDTGFVTLEYGLDLPDAEMAASDYLTLGTWRIERAELSDSVLALTVKELKSRLDTDIPLDVYTREEFPGINNDTVGKPIPFAYGRIFAAPATTIDRASRKFKVAAHRIRAFVQARIKKNLKDVADVIVTAWSQYQGTTFLTDFNDEVVNVTFSTTELTKKDSIAQVQATAGSWHQEGSLLYVQPPAGESIISGTWTVRRQQDLSAWVTTPFNTVDTSRAEFTLTEDWNRSDEVSVDFEGRLKSDGDLMENWADVVADFLDYLGEHVFDQKSFSQSRRELLIGTDRFGHEVSQLAPSYYINEKTTARDIIQEICRVAGATLYVDPSGAWRFNVFRPAMSADLLNVQNQPQLNWAHTEFLEPLNRINDAKDVFSRVLIHFAKRHAENWDETSKQTRNLNDALHGMNAVGTEERDVPIALVNDANYLGQRLLTTEGQPIYTCTTTLPRPALMLVPGDQIRLTGIRPGSYDRIMEIMGIEKDFLRGTARVTLGDRRGWSDGFGWWLIEDITTPTLPTGAWTHLRAEGLPYTSGQRIVRWFNNPIVAPGGYNADQNFASDQPLLVGNRINGLPIVRFEGTGTGQNIGWNQTPGALHPTNAGELFILLKCDNDPGASGNNAVYQNFGGSEQACEITAADGTLKEVYGLNVKIATGIDPAASFLNWRLYNVSVNAANLTIRIDGTSVYTTGAHSVGFASSGFGPRIGLGYAAGEKFVGEIAEVLIYPRVLTAGERTAVENYFATRFALGFGTPGNTPVQWNAGWTNAQAAYARQNYGWWHDSKYRIANKTTDPNDPRSFEASRWW